ncbi:hypothetical protein PSTG_10704 [Puccinia striiformis f. sp. tritici PST-78]|uniref:BED-type domain-containing protein n=1 Tax=Puccinia striiformis f. sp. tritici PST-78 TaxID=1165861 RepID=A0A0L0V9R2_9BASI|nr:hypothetical protein PSTG_10704 [Puccinia striiformis f. sp. tritici PST-78]
MAPNSKKRRKATSSPQSPTSNRGTPARSEDHSQTRPQTTSAQVDSDNDQQSIDVDSASQGGTQTSRQELSDEQELHKARKLHRNERSSTYSYFDPPQLSEKTDKKRRKMIAYRCKRCDGLINRPTYDNSTANLTKHVAICKKKIKEEEESQKLAVVGVSGTGDINPREVAQLCAIWCAEAARPFSALGESAHRGILHPIVLKNLPSRKAVSRDISILYTAVQASLIESLKNHKGGMYLGLDAWQSPNGFDILGTVIYRLVEGNSGSYQLEAMPLDFVRLESRHTGVYLAETVRMIVEKFGVKEKICGIVTDNASNNKAMVDEIKKFRWPRFNGEAQWLYCDRLEPIRRQLIRAREINKVTRTDPDDPEDHIQILENGDGRDEEEEEEEDQVSNTELAADMIDDNEIELEAADVNELSDEEDSDKYTSESCKKTLAKFRAIARKLNKSPNSKALFVKLCKEKGCSKPHTVERDVRTRWNSTLVQISSIERCSEAILTWQKDKRYGTLRSYHINQAELELAGDLIGVLQIFQEITLQVSTHGAARISQVVVFIDQITSHLSTVITNEEDLYPPALRNACRAGLQLTNKYYTLTDCSPLYRVAMVLHPSFKDEYFKLAKWQPEWIIEAIRLTREMWDAHYKPPPQPTTTKQSNIRARPQTGVLAMLSGASEARTGNTSTDALTVWLAGGLTLDNEGQPVNPLKWWIQQGRAGNTHGGLLQMALDVLSCPATTVDVERSFNFGRDYVSARRHRLSDSSLTRGMTVAFYSKNGKIERGVLRRWKLEQLNKKGKNKRGGGGSDDEIECL